MNEELIKKIDRMIEEDYQGLVEDTIKLVNIKSVREAPKPGAPFGEGPRKVLDACLAMGKERGFYTKDYGVGVVGISMKDAEPDLGVWAHGDVVPEGTGWIYEPYNAIEYKGCVIGRGATDNKGQLVCVLRLMSIFKKLGIDLKYNVGLYVGSNEESGMEDMIGIEGNPDARGFLNVCKAPKLSLVPDGGFPVGYAGKGKVEVVLETAEPMDGVSIEAGHDDAPGRAVAVLDRTDCPALADCVVERGDKVRVTAETAPCHSAHPDPNGNMITVVTKAIVDNKLVSEKDEKRLDFIRRVSCDVKGKILGINSIDEVTGETSVASVAMKTSEGKLRLSLNIRYPSSISYEEIVESISKVAPEYGFAVAKTKRGVNSYKLDINWNIITELNDISNSVTGNDSKPFSMGGGTYAHRLPNALVYGMNGNLKPEGFPEGHGGAHGVDEVVSIARLQRAMRIFACAFLRLNELEW